MKTTLQECGIKLHLLEGRLPHKIFKFLYFFLKFVSSSPFSFLFIDSTIYLYQYRLMNIYILLWVKMQYLFILLLKLFGRSFSCFWVPLISPSLFCFIFLCFDFLGLLYFPTKRCSRFIWHICYPSPRIYSSIECQFLILEVGIRKQDLDNRY